MKHRLIVQLLTTIKSLIVFLVLLNASLILLILDSNARNMTIKSMCSAHIFGGVWLILLTAIGYLVFRLIPLCVLTYKSIKRSNNIK